MSEALNRGEATSARIRGTALLAALPVLLSGCADGAVERVAAFGQASGSSEPVECYGGEFAEVCSGTEAARPACFMVVNRPVLIREVGQTFRVVRMAPPGRVRLKLGLAQPPDDPEAEVVVEVRPVEPGEDEGEPGIVSTEPLSALALAVVPASELPVGDDVEVDLRFFGDGLTELEGGEAAEYAVVIRASAGLSVRVGCHEGTGVFASGESVSRQLRLVGPGEYSEAAFTRDVRDLTFAMTVGDGCYDPYPETCGEGACQRTMAVCTNDPIGCTPHPPQPEVCNGVDDDCNGVIDDMPDLECGLGACLRTAVACIGGVPGVCVPGEPTPEECNGIDDDCNGLVDDRDCDPPQVAFVLVPAPVNSEVEPEVGFACDEPCTFECRFDGGEWTPCGSGMLGSTFVEVPGEGEYVFEVRATDLAGNESGVESIAWRTDLTPPTVTINAAPEATTFSRTATFTFECDEPCTFECRLDGGSWSTCTSPASFPRLAKGAHLLELRGIDEAGLDDTTSASWEVLPGDWAFLASGQEHTCGIDTLGVLWCWGSNGSGRLGDGTTTSRDEPVQIDVETGWTWVSGGNSHTCGIRDGELWCWGSGSGGRLGDGTTSTTRLEPRRIGEDSDWTRVAAGTSHSCGLKAGELWCWGSNATGQVGDGTNSVRSTPVRVGAETDWVELAAGGNHNCALRSGEVWCWGDGASGRLGQGSTDASNVPVRVGEESDWTTVTAGTNHSCGLRGGEAWCWGNNGNGRLGDGTGVNRLLPVQVAGSETDWTALAGGNLHTCGLRAGELYCWGSNAYGRLGDGTTTERRTPTRVGLEIGWDLAGPANQHSCGLRTGKVWCWGRNNLGQVGQLVDEGVPEYLEPVEVEMP